MHDAISTLASTGTPSSQPPALCWRLEIECPGKGSINDNVGVLRWECSTMDTYAIHEGLTRG